MEDNNLALGNFSIGAVVHLEEINVKPASHRTLGVILDFPGKSVDPLASAGRRGENQFPG